MLGVGSDYLTVRNWQMRLGEFFAERDVANANKVCVVGQTVVKQLFQTTNPIGQTIRIKNIPFEIIGVLDTKGVNIVGEDQDDLVLMPYTTVRKRIQRSNFNNVDVIMASAKSTIANNGAPSRNLPSCTLSTNKVSAGSPMNSARMVTS